MLRKRIIYALAGLALLLSVVGGALAAGVDSAVAGRMIRNDDGTGNAVPPPALAGFKTRAGGTEIAVSRQLSNTPGVVLAGFNSTKVGTEIFY